MMDPDRREIIVFVEDLARVLAPELQVHFVQSGLVFKSKLKAIVVVQLVRQVSFAIIVEVVTLS